MPTITECDYENVYDDGLKTNESTGATEFEYSTIIPPNGTPNETADIPTVAPMNTLEYDPKHVFDDDHDADDDAEQNADLNDTLTDDATDTDSNEWQYDEIDENKNYEESAAPKFETKTNDIPMNTVPVTIRTNVTGIPMNTAVPTHETKKSPKQSPSSIAQQSYEEFSKSATRKESPRPLVPCNACNTTSRRTPGSKIVCF